MSYFKFSYLVLAESAHLCAVWCKVCFGCKFLHAQQIRAQNVRCITQPPRMSFESFFYVIILCFTVDLCCTYSRDLKPWNPIHIICVNESECIWIALAQSTTSRRVCCEIVAILLSWNWVESTNNTLLRLLSLLLNNTPAHCSFSAVTKSKWDFPFAWHYFTTLFTHSHTALHCALCRCSKRKNDLNGMEWNGKERANQPTTCIKISVA